MYIDAEMTFDGLKDGLVTPPVWAVTADLLKKRSKFAEIVENVIKMASDRFSIDLK